MVVGVGSFFGGLIQAAGSVGGFGAMPLTYAGNLGSIEGLSWRPHAERDLASVSENGFLRIWNVKSAAETPKHVVRLPRDAACSRLFTRRQACRGERGT